VFAIAYTLPSLTLKTQLCAHAVGFCPIRENVWTLRLNRALVRQENKKKKRNNEEEVEKSMYFILFSPYVSIIYLYSIRRLGFLMEMLCVFCDVQTEFLRTISANFSLMYLPWYRQLVTLHYGGPGLFPDQFV
jgi:hypothetical protein